MLFNALKLAYRSVSFKLRRHDSNPINDYNKASATYDDYYSLHLGPSAQGLMDKLPIRPGMEIVDLACGTGFFSHQIAAAVGSGGRLTSVDLSSGMLARNRQAAAARGLTNIRFIESDVIELLKSMPDASVDGLVCGWGICYMDHARLRREAERVTRSGGFLGIIENTSSSLGDVSKLFTKALLRNPGAITKNVALNLPGNHVHLTETFCTKALVPVEAWDGEVLVPCRSGAEIADYMVKSGASAGFLDALDQTLRDRVIQDFIMAVDVELRRGRRVPVRHEYCALVARKA